MGLTINKNIRIHTLILLLILLSGSTAYAYNSKSDTTIHAAVRKGNVKKVAELLNDGVDVNTQNNKDQTPLFIAAEVDNIEISRLLLEHGADPEIASEFEYTPLKIATSKGNTDLVKLLMDHGADMYHMDWIGSPVCHIAAYNGYIDIMKYFLDKGLDINYQDGTYLSYTLIHAAASRGKTKMVEFLIDRGAEFNKTTPTNSGTPLNEAIQHHHNETAAFLLEKGADPTICNYEGRGPVYTALINNNPEGLELLLNTGKFQFADNPETHELLCAACFGGVMSFVQELVALGVDIEAKNRFGESPVSEAVSGGQTEIFKYLHKHGADLLSPDDNQNTTLHMAFWDYDDKKRIDSKLEIADYILKEDINVNIKNKYGDTPLHDAMKSLQRLDEQGDQYRKLSGIIMLMVKKGADIFAENNDGNKAYSYADARHKTLFESILHKDNLQLEMLLLKDVDPEEFTSIPYLEVSPDDERKDPEFLSTQMEIEPWNEPNSYSRFGFSKQTLVPLTQTESLIIENGEAGILETGTNNLLFSSYHKFHNSGYYWLGNALLTIRNTKYTLIDPYFTKEYTNDLTEFLTKDSLHIVDTYYSTSLAGYILFVNNVYHEDPATSIIFYYPESESFKIQSPSILTTSKIIDPENCFISPDGNWILMRQPAELEESSYYRDAYFEYYLYHFNSGYPNNISPPVYCGKTEGYPNVEYKHHKKYGNVIVLSEYTDNLFIIQLDKAFEVLGKQPSSEVSPVFKGDVNTEIHEAVLNNNFEEVKKLADQGADLNQAGRLHFTPLHLAIFQNSPEIARYLIEKGADINKKGLGGMTPLYLSCYKNNTEIAGMLLDQGADANISIISGSTPLFCAVYYDNAELVKELKKSGADPYLKNVTGQRPAYVALAKFRRKEILETLFDNYVHIDSSCYNQAPPLHAAAAMGNVYLANYLIRKGADVNLHGEAFAPPLHIALDREYRYVALLLIENGADIKLVYDEETPLGIAFDEDLYDVCEILIRKGADVNQLHRGNTLLYRCTEYGDTTFLRILINNGANINEVDYDGRTVLHTAASNNNHDVLEVLLSTGLDPDVQDNKGNTPLHLAVSLQQPEAIRLLVENGADVNIKNKEGETPVMRLVYAQRKTFFNHNIEDPKASILKLLIDNGANINVVDKNGNTLLHYFTSLTIDHDIVSMLIQNNADPMIFNANGNLAFHTAFLDGNYRFMFQLIDAGFDPGTPDKGGNNIFHLMVLHQKYHPGYNLEEIFKERNISIRGDRTYTKFLVNIFDDPEEALNARNDLGLTPLHLATLIGNTELAESLIKAGADPNIADDQGNTCLHLTILKFAAMRDQKNYSYPEKNPFTYPVNCTEPIKFDNYFDLQILKLLWASGANPELANNKGETPKDLAKKYGLDLNVVQE